MIRRGVAAGIFATAIAIGVYATASAGIGELPGEPLGKSHGLRYLVATVPDALTGDIEVNVECAEPTGITGGGAHFQGSPKSSRVSSGLPFPAFLLGDDSFEADGQNFKGPGKSFSVYAICLTQNADALTYAIGDTKTVPGDIATARADCEPGTKLLSGGFDLDDGNIVQSRPVDDDDANRLPDDGWKVKGRQGTGEPGLLAVGVCTAGPASIAYRSSGGKIGGDRAKALRASCPRSKALAGGGFQIGGSPKVNTVHSLRPRDSKADAKKVPDDVFEASLVNNSNKQRRAKAYALCLG